MPVHMRNGRAYGGIPNGIVKAETPSSVPTTVKQLNVVGAVGDIAPVTIPEAVKFENGNTMEDAVENFAQIETSPTTSTHAVGTHLVWNGILYMVKTAIDSGENLVINSNIERTYVADEIEALNNDLMSKPLKKQVISAFSQNGNTWIAPSNGILVFAVQELVSGAAYVYISDGDWWQAGTISCPNGTGGLTHTVTIPVRKGITYSLNMYGFTTGAAFFYSLDL